MEKHFVAVGASRRIESAQARSKAILIIIRCLEKRLSRYSQVFNMFPAVVNNSFIFPSLR